MHINNLSPLMAIQQDGPTINFSLRDSYLSMFSDISNMKEIILELPEHGISLTDSIFWKVETMYAMRYKRKASSLKFKIEDVSSIVDLIKSFDDIGILKYNFENNYGVDESIILISDSQEVIIKLACSQEDNLFESDAQRLHYVEFLTTNLKILNDVGQIAETVKHSKTVENSTPIFIFERSPNGDMFLTPHTLQKFDLDVDKHYNPEFTGIHSRIQEWCEDINSINKKLVLLSGTPGTGKTNYIKNLIASQKGRRVIYVPPYQVGAIADPAFFSFISKYKNSLLIVEDAERILVSREDNSGNEAVSLMLNMTDGILASALNFKIICTFNTDESKIDEALMRNGRLFLKYKFGELNEERTDALYRELYGTKPPKEKMTLAAIYENVENGFEKKEEKKIGFAI